MRFEHLGIDFDGLFVLAYFDQDHRPQIAIGGIVRVEALQQIDLTQSGGGLVLPLQHDRILMAGGHETRRELQASLQQDLGARVAAQACRDLGQHAQRDNIRFMLLQVRAQAMFGLGNLALDQCRRRGQQPRILGRRLDVARIGGIRT